MWENRKDCLHNPTGAPLARIDKRLNKQLVHYKRNRKSLLTYTNRNWIEHPKHTIRNWSHKKKRQLLRVLDGWHSKHKAETTVAVKNQKFLLEFVGFMISHPPERRQNMRDSGTS